MPGDQPLADLPDAAPLRAALAAGTLRFAPPAPEEDVRAFEAEHGVALPAEYRRLITEVGNGGDGPPLYGVEPLSARRVEHGAVPGDERPALIAAPFPAVERADLEDLGPQESDRVWTEYDQGRLLLGTDGCAILFVLVVTGPARGEVWRLDEVAATREAPGVLAWYAAWLDRGGAAEHPTVPRPVPVALDAPPPRRRLPGRRRPR